MLRIKFEMPLAGISSTVLAIDDQIRNIEIDNALPVADNAVILSLTIQCDSAVSEETLLNKLSNIQVIDISQTETEGYTYHLGVLTEISNAPVLISLTTNETIPHRIIGKHSHIEVIASMRDWNHLKTVAGTIEEKFGEIKLVGTTQTDSIGFPLGANKVKQTMSGKLSQKQLTVLETAYRMGYFTIPQEVNAKEIADELDISRSTLSERLRGAEHALCALLFGPRT